MQFFAGFPLAGGHLLDSYCLLLRLVGELAGLRHKSWTLSGGEGHGIVHGWQRVIRTITFTTFLSGKMWLHQTSKMCRCVWVVLPVLAFAFCLFLSPSFGILIIASTRCTFATARTHSKGLWVQIHQRKIWFRTIKPLKPNYLFWDVFKWFFTHWSSKLPTHCEGTDSNWPLCGPFLCTGPCNFWPAG